MSHDALSATDRAFLGIEDHALAMHVGATIVLERGDLLRPDGTLDIDRVMRLVSSGVEQVPRFRQHVRAVPGLGAVWVDDPGFQLDYHVRHTSIDHPGSHEQLMTLAGRVFGQALDRHRPLWEMWFVEGLEGGRVALLTKVHHAMIDGVAGMSILGALFRTEPFDDVPPPVARAASAEPSTLALAKEIIAERAAAVASALRHAPEALTLNRDTLKHVGDTASGLAATLREGVIPADVTRLNPDSVGQQRTFAGVRLDLDRVRRTRRALSGTVNDVALAAVAGGLRRYFLRHGDDVDKMRDVRAFIPVNLRPRQGRTAAEPGNHVSLVLARMPIHEPDPRARFDEVHRVCDHLKHGSHEIEAAELIESIGDLGGPNIVHAIFRAAMALRAFNIVVTNVPGPPISLYCGRARMESIWGVVPLFAHQGVAISLISYGSDMFVGLYADPDAVPDLEALGADVLASFDELATAAGE